MLQPKPVCRISVNGGQKQQRKALQGAPDFENGFIIGQQLRNQRKIQNNKQRQRPVFAAATGIKPAKSAGQQSQRQPYQQFVQTCARFCRTISEKPFSKISRPKKSAQKHIRQRQTTSTSQGLPTTARRQRARKRKSDKARRQTKSE